MWWTRCGKPGLNVDGTRDEPHFPGALWLFNVASAAFFAPQAFESKPQSQSTPFATEPFDYLARKPLEEIRNVKKHLSSCYITVMTRKYYVFQIAFALYFFFKILAYKLKSARL